MHLGCHEPLPDELVEFELVVAEKLPDLPGATSRRGGPDGLVSILGVLAAAVIPGLGRQILLAVVLSNVGSDFAQRVAGDPERIRTHVGDQADAAFLSQLDPFVEALSHSHGLFHGKPQLAGRFLLKLAGDEGGDGIPLLFLGRDGFDSE